MVELVLRFPEKRPPSSQRSRMEASRASRARKSSRGDLKLAPIGEQVVGARRCFEVVVVVVIEERFFEVVDDRFTMSELRRRIDDEVDV